MKKSDIIISHIQAKEAELWLDLTVYINRALKGISSRAEYYEFRTRDTGYLERRAAWEAISETLDELGLDSNGWLDDHRRAVYISNDNNTIINNILRRRDT